MLTYIVNWTLRNSEIYFTLLFLTLLLFVYYGEEILNWIELELKENELNWNWIERFWIRFEFELNWIEKSWIQLELELNWIERNELIRALAKIYCWYDSLSLTNGLYINVKNGCLCLVCPCVCVCMSVYQACPYDNSSPVQGRISKFRPEV